MESSTEWFEYCRTLSGPIRAQQARDQRMREVLKCDDCQTSEHIECPAHPVNFVATGE